MHEIDASVIIGNNVTIEPFVVIKGNTVIGDNTFIGSFSYICNSAIGKDCVIKSSRIVDSVVENYCSVGPNAHLRDKAVVEDNCRIGNFVEIKNSTLEKGVKASHLAYIGDAIVGCNTNIGCGVIFVNYNGKLKNKSTVGKNCFIGCNTNIVAPVEIGDDCYIACGTTVDKNIPSGAFAIGRSYLTIKEGKAFKYFKR